MNELAIEACDLSKTFHGGVAAVSRLDLAVPKGAVYGLIGRNGAGKTTLIRMLMALLRPSGGSARVLGRELWNAPERHRARVTYVSQIHRLPGAMNLESLCGYLSRLYERWDAAYARRMAGRFELDWARPVGAMSGGEQRKAAVLLAFAARPEAVLLDEPAAGLDPIARRALIDEIVELITAGDGCTVFFSTHIISDLERVAEIVGIMDRGRMVAQAPLDDLRSRTKRVQVVFTGQSPPEGFTIPGAIRSRVEGPVVTAVVNIVSETQFDDLHRRPDARVNIFPLGLEEIFVDLFGPGMAGESGGIQ